MRMTEKEWAQFAQAHNLDPRTGKKIDREAERRAAEEARQAIARAFGRPT